MRERKKERKRERERERKRERERRIDLITNYVIVLQPLDIHNTH